MSYIGNTNTRRLHHPGCRAVPMIAPEHIRYSEDGEGFPVVCKWCGCQGFHKGQITLDEFKRGGRNMKSEGEIIGEYTQGDSNIKECNEKQYVDIFREVGCIIDGEKEGAILMYPHDGGVPVEGEIGKWWIFHVCSKCGHETSLEKSANKLLRKLGGGERFGP